MPGHNDQIGERVLIKQSLDRYPIPEELIGRTGIRAAWRSGPDGHTTHWLLRPDGSETSILAEPEDLWVWGRSLSPLIVSSYQPQPGYGFRDSSPSIPRTPFSEIEEQVNRPDPDRQPAESHSSKRENLPPKLQYNIWQRDAWHCRYCLNPLFFAPTLKELDRRAPGRGIYHPNGKLTAMLPIFAFGWASVDHYLPVSSGGTNDELNLMSACWGCNLEFGAIAPTAKNLRVIPEDVRSLNWDGLSSLYLSLVLKPDRWTPLIEGSSSRESGKA